MDGRDEAGGAERALARLNERPADASVKSATWTCALLMSSSSTSDDRALASIGVGKPYPYDIGRSRLPPVSFYRYCSVHSQSL